MPASRPGCRLATVRMMNARGVPLLLPLVLLLSACGGGGGDDGAAAGNGSLEAEEEVAAEWTLAAAEFRDRIGLRVAYDCPPGGAASSVWGTGPFTDDSSVCTAAVFDGLITFEDGGRVVAEIQEGLESYDEGEAFGVTAGSWPSWPGSFDFPES